MGGKGEGIGAGSGTKGRGGKGEKSGGSTPIARQIASKSLVGRICDSSRGSKSVEGNGAGNSSKNTASQGLGAERGEGGSGGAGTLSTLVSVLSADPTQLKTWDD